MEIIWTRSALKRVEEIGNFIALDSSERAVQFIDKLIASVERLIKFPFSSPLLPQHPAFRQMVFEGYRIVYRISDHRIEIVTVLGPRQNI